MPDSTTSNYGWTLPTNNADDDTWGTLLNADWSALDGQLNAVSGVANAAMPKAGGTFTGPVSGTSGSFSGAVAAGALTGPLTGAVTGNASTASALQAARTLVWTGDAAGSLSFDGSANASAALTLPTVNADTGAFGSASAVPVVTLDGKGRVTAASTAPILPGVPTGAIMAFAMSTPPTGWLECDGSTFSAGTYPALATALGGTTLPDLRGQFLRGWDNGRGLDPTPSRAMLSSQADQMQGHVHPLNAPNGVLPAGTTGEGFTGVTGTNTSSPVTATGAPASDGPNGTPRTGVETRPTNVAVMYCIKT